MKEIRVCPECGNAYTERPALSRKDNSTEICPACGMNEALEEWRVARLRAYADSTRKTSTEST